MSSRHCLLVATWALASLAPGQIAHAGADCSIPHGSFTGLNSHGTVNLVYGGQSAPLANAVLAWNETCGDGIPSFTIRSQPQSGAININVVIVDTAGIPGCPPDTCGCAESAIDNETGELVGGTIRLTTFFTCQNQTATAMHELGHILGLAHASDPECANRIMYPFPSGTSATVQADDCAGVDGLWETPSEISPDPDGDGEYEPHTPILIDLDRDLFHLTGLGNPVLFDIDADGELELLSWTSAETLDAFLALDRNGNGSIDDGTELFGNVTPLVDGSTAENGYIPLSEFDLPALGGNDNRWIDPGDVIYPELRLWIDHNHNGLSEPDEILGLAEAGVTRIGLHYLMTPFTDQHGNRFRYAGLARLLVDGWSRLTWTTDVFFVVGQESP